VNNNNARQSITMQGKEFTRTTQGKQQGQIMNSSNEGEK
jgi:hypothetical protein